MDKYKSLEGICVRALRLEMIILSVYHINELRSVSHMCEELDRREIPPTIGALIRHKFTFKYFKFILNTYYNYKTSCTC